MKQRSIECSVYVYYLISLWRAFRLVKHTIDCFGSNHTSYKSNIICYKEYHFCIAWQFRYTNSSILLPHRCSLAMKLHIHSKRF